MAVTRRWLLVDGNNALVRSIKAMERANLSAAGLPTAALHTFVRMMSRYVREVQPDRMVVCWDGGRSTMRTEVYEGYKEARATSEYAAPLAVLDIAPDDPKASFHLAKEFLSLANIHHIEMPGVEADDLIAAYWRVRRPDDRVVILSGDRDFLQLCDGWTEQIRPGTGEDDRWTSNRVRTKYECKPEDLPKVMALMGDPGDGVPGLPGFGPKTAVKLLKEHGWDLDAFLDSGHKKLPLGARADVERNLRLVNLREAYPGSPEVDLPPAFEPTDVGSILHNDLVAFLDRFEMHQVKDAYIRNQLWRDQ